MPGIISRWRTVEVRRLRNSSIWQVPCVIINLFSPITLSKRNLPQKIEAQKGCGWAISHKHIRSMYPYCLQTHRLSNKCWSRSKQRNCDTYGSNHETVAIDAITFIYILCRFTFIAPSFIKLAVGTELYLQNSQFDTYETGTIVFFILLLFYYVAEQ